jgi:hypothetical protein
MYDRDERAGQHDVHEWRASRKVVSSKALNDVLHEIPVAAYCQGIPVWMIRARLRHAGVPLNRYSVAMACRRLVQLGLLRSEGKLYRREVDDEA